MANLSVARAGQWIALLVGSAALAALLRWANFPAAWMLGPMLAGIVVGVRGGTIRIPLSARALAQVVLGCMIAGTVTPDILRTLWKQWPVCLAVVLAAVLASSLLGWAIARMKVIPGSTAVWGLSPGGASVMVLMADEFGADARLVAFMQYLRVVCVAGGAALIARFWVHANPAAAPSADLFPPIHGLDFAATLAVGAVGAALGHVLRLPAGLILGPFLLGAVLHACGAVPIELPRWLLVASYAIIGWRIGLVFTRSILLYAARALPQTLLCIVLLMTFCGGLAGVLVWTLGIDPLTAYLATSPGGLDSAAVIGASTPVDLPFILTLQTIRVVIVLFLGPPAARFVARQLQPKEPPKPEARCDLSLSSAGRVVTTESSSAPNCQSHRGTASS